VLKRLLSGAAAIALPLALLIFPGTASASAETEASAEAVELVDCPGYAFQQFTPGLKLLPQNIRFDAEGSFGPCVTTSPEHAFAEYQSQGEALLSCSISLPVFGVSGTIRWSDVSGNPSGVSHFSGGISLAERPAGENVVVVLATIDSGDFAGSQMIYEIVLLNTDLAKCLTTGIEQVAGPTNLTILSP
jgi:hypothetical protein